MIESAANGLAQIRRGLSGIVSLLIENDFAKRSEGYEF